MGVGGSAALHSKYTEKREFALKAVQPWALEMETIVRYKLTTILVVVNNNDGIYSGLDSIH